MDFQIINLKYLGLPDGSPDCVDKPTGHGGGTQPQTTPHGLTINASTSTNGSVDINVAAETPFKVAPLKVRFNSLEPKIPSI